MSSKKPSLSAALREATRPVAIEPNRNVLAAKVMAPNKAPGRLGLKVISGHFDPAVSKQFRLLAVEHDTNVQDLLAEAINDLFIKYGKSTIA